jgi:hypothetical protein
MKGLSRMEQQNSKVPAQIEAAALRNAFPLYAVSVSVREGDHPRFEVVTRNDANPWCLISARADEIWRELKGSTHA